VEKIVGSCQLIHLLSANTGENVSKAISADPMKKDMIQIQGVLLGLFYLHAS
jgi:hypothetical protein